MSGPKKPGAEEAVKSCYSTWSGSYYEDYSRSGKAYPPVHADIVSKRREEARVRTLLDAGCGPASMLRDLAAPGRELSGFDLTPEMVAEARKVLPDAKIWEGSVTDPKAYRGGPYDAAICFGVFPHIRAQDDVLVLKNLASSVRKGGEVFVEARNELFALFTLNRYSRDMFHTALIDVSALAAKASAEERKKLEEALEQLDERFRMDLPPVRKGKSGEPGYDEVLSRTHNPFVLAGQARAAGLADVEVLFYHYHCLPPMLEAAVPQLFRAASVAMEDPKDWRGHFMASAFIVAGRRPE
jgi:SAM-dependent methyltransferase